jgi:hypothetical protein
MLFLAPLWVLSDSFTAIDVLHGEWDIHNGSIADHLPDPSYYFECHVNKSKRSVRICTIWFSNSPVQLQFRNIRPMLMQLEAEFRNGNEFQVRSSFDAAYTQCKFVPEPKSNALTSIVTFANFRIGIRIESRNEIHFTFHDYHLSFVAFLQPPVLPQTPGPPEDVAHRWDKLMAKAQSFWDTSHVFMTKNRVLIKGAGYIVLVEVVGYFIFYCGRRFLSRKASPGKKVKHQ